MPEQQPDTPLYEDPGPSLFHHDLPKLVKEGKKEKEMLKKSLP